MTKHGHQTHQKPHTKNPSQGHHEAKEAPEQPKTPTVEERLSWLEAQVASMLPPQTVASPAPVYRRPKLTAAEDPNEGIRQVNDRCWELKIGNHTSYHPDREACRSHKEKLLRDFGPAALATQPITPAGMPPEMAVDQYHPSEEQRQELRDYTKTPPQDAANFPGETPGGKEGAEKQRG